MNKYKYSNFYNDLIEEFPEFSKEFQVNSLYYFDNGIPQNYIIIRDFLDYYKDRFINKDQGSIEKIYTFLTNLLNSQEPELESLCIIGFLESLDPEISIYQNIKSDLPIELRNKLDEIEKFWNKGE